MKAKLANFAKILPVLLVVGCGASPAVSGTPAGNTTKTAPVATQAAKTGDVTTSQIQIQGAYARLQASPGTVQKGGRATLWLNVWSDDKPIRSYEAQWYASEGMLDRFYTRSSSMNGWWAPFNPVFQNSQIQARVRVDFEDGTTATGTLATTIWVLR